MKKIVLMVFLIITPACKPAAARQLVLMIHAINSTIKTHQYHAIVSLRQSYTSRRFFSHQLSARLYFSVAQ